MRELSSEIVECCDADAFRRAEGSIRQRPQSRGRAGVAGVSSPGHAWIVPIPGTRKLEHLEENIGATDIELTPDDLRELGSAYSKLNVQGARLSEEQMKLIDRAA